MYLFLLEAIMCSALERLLFPYAFSALGILSRVLSDDDWDVAWTWLGHHAVKVYIRVGVSWLAPFLLFGVVPLLLCVSALGLGSLTLNALRILRWGPRRIWQRTRDRRNRLRCFLVFKFRRLAHTLGIVRRPTHGEYFDQAMRLATMANAQLRIISAQQWTPAHQRLADEEFDAMWSNVYHIQKGTQGLVDEERIYHFEPIKALLDECLTSPGKIPATPEIMAAIEYAKERERFTQGLRNVGQHWAIYAGHLSIYPLEDYMRLLADRVSFEAGELAFAAASHPRLGGESPAHGLSADLVERVLAHAFPPLA